MRNFTVSPSKKTKILMVFSSVILLLLISAFFYLIFVEGFPFEEELYIQIFFFVMMTVFIFCLIGAIDNMTRTISVDGKNIHSKSFLSSKTFTFDDISIMPSDVKSTTRIQGKHQRCTTKDCKKLVRRGCGLLYKGAEWKKRKTIQSAFNSITLQSKTCSPCIRGNYGMVLAVRF